ncbi:hypothetical protein M434DRAFT_33511 [Hypoxylon sp. CO27-5]|nr:hypothetical protein M434DRAFT_33511 [Hypoxylon sp. CO27-5]
MSFPEMSFPEMSFPVFYADHIAEAERELRLCVEEFEKILKMYKEHKAAKELHTELNVFIKRYTHSLSKISRESLRSLVKEFSDSSQKLYEMLDSLKDDLNSCKIYMEHQLAEKNIALERQQDEADKTECKCPDVPCKCPPPSQCVDSTDEECGCPVVPCTCPPPCQCGDCSEDSDLETDNEYECSEEELGIIPSII